MTSMKGAGRLSASGPTAEGMGHGMEISLEAGSDVCGRRR